MITCESESPDRTIEIGRRLGERLRPGDVVSLVGDLGSGKTVFVKGVALGAGLPDAAAVTSPTFVLMNAYEGRLPLKHYDLYRVEDGSEIESLGFSDFRADSAILIEWGDRVPAAILGPHLRVEFEPTGESGRTLRFRDEGISPEGLNLAS